MCIEGRILKLWNYYSLGGLLLAIFISEKNKKSFLQQQFTDISWIVVFITITVILLVNHGLLHNPYYILGFIDSGTLLASIMIFISCIRHGYFSNK